MGFQGGITSSDPTRTLIKYEATSRLSMSPSKIDEALIKRLRQQEKYLDVSGAFMGLTGLVLSIAEFEWYYNAGYQSYWYNDMFRALVFYENTCQISLTTLILLTCIGRRAYLEYNAKMEKGLVLRT